MAGKRVRWEEGEIGQQAFVDEFKLQVADKGEIAAWRIVTAETSVFTFDLVEVQIALGGAVNIASAKRCAVKAASILRDFRSDAPELSDATIKNSAYLRRQWDMAEDVLRTARSTAPVKTGSYL
jgi:hypothetical protein